jgi:hypothetical protein
MQRLRTLIVLILAILAPTALAQEEISVESQLSSTSAYVGEELTLQVLVRGADSPDQPRIDFPDQLGVEYRGVSRNTFSSTRIINGRQTTTRDDRYTHTYRLTVKEDGLIEIPPARMTINGRVYESHPSQLVARLPQIATTDTVEIILPDRSVYVGESINAEVVWWIGGSTSGFSFDSSNFPRSVRVAPGAIPEPNGDQRAFEFLGEQAVGVVEQTIRNGQPMTRLRFSLRITPTETGPITIGPIRAVFVRADDFNRGRRAYAESDPVTLDVVNVPTAGRPDGYSGLIGQYSVSTGASNTRVNVGDPIELQLLVRGDEPMVGISGTLSTRTLEAAGFRTAPDGWRESERRRTGERLYTTTIRATDASIEQIPPIELPTFDPERGEFVVARSAPISLDVRAVRQVTLDDAIVADPSGSPPARRELQRNTDILWAHPSAEQILGSEQRFDLLGAIRSPVTISILGLSLGAPFLALLWRVWFTDHDPDQARIHRAWKRARALHAKGEHARALRVYAGALLNADPDSLTSDDLSRLSASASTLESTRRLLTTDESEHYAPAPIRAERPAPDRRILHQLRREARPIASRKGARS